MRRRRGKDPELAKISPGKTWTCAGCGGYLAEPSLELVEQHLAHCGEPLQAADDVGSLATPELPAPGWPSYRSQTRGTLPRRRCPACGEGTLEMSDELRWGVCISCHDAGRRPAAPTAPEPTPRPELAPCSRCGHDVLVRCVPRERFSVKTERKTWRQRTGPLAVAHERDNDGAHLILRQIGPLHAFVCRRCGFVHWYVGQPERIPIGDDYDTELVRAGVVPRPPYR